MPLFILLCSSILHAGMKYFKPGHTQHFQPENLLTIIIYRLDFVRFRNKHIPVVLPVYAYSYVYACMVTVFMFTRNVSNNSSSSM